MRNSTLSTPRKYLSNYVDWASKWSKIDQNILPAFFQNHWDDVLMSCSSNHRVTGYHPLGIFRFSSQELLIPPQRGLNGIKACSVSDCWRRVHVALSGPSGVVRPGPSKKHSKLIRADPSHRCHLKMLWASWPRRRRWLRHGEAKYGETEIYQPAKCLGRGEKPTKTEIMVVLVSSVWRCLKCFPSWVSVESSVHQKWDVQYYPIFCAGWTAKHTVDGGNPAPVSRWFIPL